MVAITDGGKCGTIILGGVGMNGRVDGPDGVVGESGREVRGKSTIQYVSLGQ